MLHLEFTSAMAEHQPLPVKPTRMLTDKKPRPEHVSRAQAGAALCVWCEREGDGLPEAGRAGR